MSAAGSVLALDLGTKCGFAILRADGRVLSGQVGLHPRAGEGPGARYIRFRRWLHEAHAQHPDLRELAFEEVMGHGPGQVLAAHVYGGLLATLQVFAEQVRLPLRPFGVGVVKKRFTGSGRAGKDDVVAQCRALGFDPKTEDEADAIALLHVATGREPILTMCGASPKKAARAKTPPALEPGADPF